MGKIRLYADNACDLDLEFLEQLQVKNADYYRIYKEYQNYLHRICSYRAI